MRKISFDYDGTLSRQEIFNAAELLLRGNYILYVITKRFDYPQKNQKHANNDIRDVCQTLKIPKDHLIFTNGLSKAKFIELNNIDIHFENNLDEINEISDKTNVNLIYVGEGGNWLNKMFAILARLQNS